MTGTTVAQPGTAPLSTTLDPGTVPLESGGGRVALGMADDKAQEPAKTDAAKVDAPKKPVSVRETLESVKADMDKEAADKGEAAAKDAKAKVDEATQVKKTAAAIYTDEQALAEAQIRLANKVNREKVVAQQKLLEGERKVLVELLTEEQIAEQLAVTIKGVEWHLSRVYRKLGIGSREELAPLLDDADEISVSA